jgi:hypothetical protein
MKILKYQLMTEVNHGTEEEPNIVQTFSACEIQCTEETFESNYALALKEAYSGEVTVEEVGEPLTPAQQREAAYNTAKIIPWEGGNITVTEAAQMWQYYAAEGNPKAEELTALIAKAKTEIRERYPDN